MSVTPVLGIVELTAAQAQPEVPVNNATRTLEQGARLYSVIDEESTPPSGSPAPHEGDAYLVVATATDAWAGHEKSIAFLAGGQWLFIPPTPGALCYNQNSAAYKKFTGGAWGSASI